MKIKLLLFLFIIFCYSYSAEYYDTITNFTIIKVRDGDTFMIDIPNIPDVFGKNIAVRIRGIDTPELNDSREEIRKISIQAKEELEKLFNSGDASQRDAIGDSRQKPKVILILYKLQKRTDNFIIQLRILFFKRKYFEV